MTTKCVVNGELTPEALMTSDMIRKCKFHIGPNIPIRTAKDKSQADDQTSANSRQFHQKFIEVAYPDGSKSGGMIIPQVVVHHGIFNYYGKQTVYVGIPQWFVQAVSLQLLEYPENPTFQDKVITSDSSYWWTKYSYSPAEEGKEYIRMIVDDENEDVFVSFTDLFNEFPTSVVCNVTCSLKMGTDTELLTVPKGGETWRAGLAITMVTPYDSIEVAAPVSGNKAKSLSGKADVARKGLLSKRVGQN